MRIESRLDRHGVRLARAALVAAALLAGWEAFMPGFVDIHRPWDKAGHFCVFYGLTLLSLAVFPKARVGWLMLVLAACGAVIELIQAIPVVGRDAEWGDLIADVVGIIFAVAPALAWRIRRRAQPRSSGG